MSEDPDVIMLGEDIIDPYGGAFKVTKGLSDKFPDRVFTTPISEAAIVGIANGLALRNKKPVVEIMFGDFISLAFDQILNHLSKFRSMYNNQVDPHVVIRTPMGGYRGYGPTHSQSLEKFLIGIPNIRVVYPSHIHALDDMLFNAIVQQNGPIIFIENKLLYSTFNSLPADGRLDDFYIVHSDGYFPTLTLSLNNFDHGDVTFVTFGGMTPMVLSQAVHLLIEEEILCEIVVLSEISPLDISPILASLKRTGRIITVEEGTTTASVGSEIIASVTTSGFQLLKVPPKKVAAIDDIVPSSKELERKYLPSKQLIFDTVTNMMTAEV